MKKKLSIILTLVIIAVLVIIGVVTNIKDETVSKIDYSETEIPAVVEADDDNGNIEIENGAVIEDDKGEYILEDVPTVEEVDGGLFEDADEDGNDQGSIENYDVSSPQAFKDATLGKCIVANNKYGAQCVSLARVFWYSYANRDITTCHTGAARGIANCQKENAGDEFEIISSKTSLQAGDWIVFNGGLYGHVGMALGPDVNNYIALLGENQGGVSCSVGGAATNIINISLKNFIVAFRPKKYIKEEPETSENSESNSQNSEKSDNSGIVNKSKDEDQMVITYTYKKGDYFSKVLVELGLDEGHLWGENGTVNYYTKQLIKQDMLDSRGNVKIGKEFVLTTK